MSDKSNLTEDKTTNMKNKTFDVKEERARSVAWQYTQLCTLLLRSTSLQLDCNRVLTSTFQSTDSETVTSLCVLCQR